MKNDSKPVALSILLIDDEPDIRKSVGGYLNDVGHTVLLAEDGRKGLSILDSQPIDIVITDLKMPGMDGFGVLSEVRRRHPRTEVIMVTAHGDVRGAVQAMRDGAFDFFTKPVQLRELTASMERTARFHALRQEVELYKERLDRLLIADSGGRHSLPALIGDSPAFQEVKALVAQVAETDSTTVLVEGETGTGKELVSRAICYESARFDKPFIPIDCSAIPEALVESEFYGHVKGAFTGANETRKGHFELADAGTIFLDEIGDMDLGMQSRLLRTLEERSIRPVGGSKEIRVDVRVISATNRNLAQAVGAGEFRQDLFYRINTFTIRIPPLRERLEDVPLLARHFLVQYTREMRKPLTGFTAEALAALTEHSYPGNVRELRNIVERAVIMSQGDKVGIETLQLDTLAVSGPDAAPQSLNLAEHEKSLIEEALRRTQGRKSRAAGCLGISRDALSRRIERHGL